jgi:capsular polysaccharide export protein
LKTIFGENGYFYNTIQLDPAGVNQAASITPRIAQEFAQIDLEPSKLEQLKSLIDIYRQNKSVSYTPGRNMIKATWTARMAGEISNLLEADFKWRGTYNSKIPASIDRLPEHYVFIPFQVVKDSQLLLYSPLVGNDMESFLDHCRTAVKQVAEDYRIIVKLHPADLDNVDYSQLPERYPDVIFLKDYPSNQLIQGSNLVITINSTVGVEALLHDKPVITLGNNFYNVPGVVNHVDDLSELPHAIETALNTPPDKEKIQRLLYYLYHEYFTHGSWKNFSVQSLEAVATKISQLLGTPD